jgi:hypothetical protein
MAPVKRYFRTMPARRKSSAAKDATVKPAFDSDAADAALHNWTYPRSEAIRQIASEAGDNIVALHGQLLSSNESPACFWFLANHKKDRNLQVSRLGSCLIDLCKLDAQFEFFHGDSNNVRSDGSSEGGIYSGTLDRTFDCHLN